MSAAVQPPPSKVDPESLVLRGPPARVTRFRRGAIVALAASASIAIVVLAWVALQPASLSLVASGEDRAPAAARPPDTLAAAPRSYGDVPRLGPPLPGDLGRPILAHQRELETGSVEGQAAGRSEAADAERQRLAAERQAARRSGVLMSLADGRSGQGYAGGRGMAPASLAEVPANASAGQTPRLGRADQEDDVSPHRLTAPASPYLLSAGSIIAASLITGLNSDLPGFVTAQVTENAYDSVTGQILLVPQGSRLIGSYDNVVAYGQSRALVVWRRIILPDGSAIRIDNVPATDLAGYAGLSDRIDRHGWRLLRGVMLSTLLGVGSELSLGSSESDLVRAIRESTQQNGARAGDQLVGRSLDIRPTLRVRPGWPLRVVVHKDIVLRPWRG